MFKGLSKQLRFIKEPIRSRGGAVAATNQTAADVGARVLSKGGNAVDAAIAAAFALGVLEPWTSGLGGVGCTIIWDASQRRGHVINFQGRAPRPSQHDEARAATAALTRRNDDLGQDIAAYRSIAVPGQPDGLWRAHVFASKPWTTLLAPAIEISESGLRVDWREFLTISTAAAELARFPASSAWLAPPDFPSSFRKFRAEYRLRNPALTATLKALAERGARDFYEGMVAHTLLSDLSRGGSRIDKIDLASYRAALVEPTVVSHTGKRFLVPPGIELGELFSESLNMGQDFGPHLDRAAIANIAHILSAAQSACAIAGANFDFDEWSSHVSVIDGDGNMASISQTLGSVFGSKIVLPETGILANNSCLALEQRKGDHSSPDADPRAASHLLPILGISGERPWLAIGIAGDWNILPAMLQLIWFLTDFGFSLADAFHLPRIDVNKFGDILVDVTAPTELKNSLHAAFGAVERDFSLTPFSRSSAIAVSVDPVSGECIAMTEVSELLAGAAAACH